ncbi:uncharacterized protein KY384_007981 [Bacidia gigantensis]|uniref:uncharacterized protein n=1 Tax=Bacidia gigantensis TaxID=2732470 RepID=UPI001D05AB7C|nr:uncharacterized protein KY384_007981 [Bacidia gigantensis]KAG8527237.1 hypothetical protein KY384_007981 [Bacidia gigantensis]
MAGLATSQAPFTVRARTDVVEIKVPETWIQLTLDPDDLDSEQFLREFRLKTLRIHDEQRERLKAYTWSDRFKAMQVFVDLQTTNARERVQRRSDTQTKPSANSSGKRMPPESKGPSTIPLAADNIQYHTASTLAESNDAISSQFLPSTPQTSPSSSVGNARSKQPACTTMSPTTPLHSSRANLKEPDRHEAAPTSSPHSTRAVLTNAETREVAATSSIPASQVSATFLSTSTNRQTASLDEGMNTIGAPNSGGGWL